MSPNERDGRRRAGGANAPRQIAFDPTAEIFATDTAGSFLFPLVVNGEGGLDLAPYDEIRLVFSVWHPSERRSIDLDRAYLELRAGFGSEDFDADEPERWTRIAEIEPVVPPYGSDSFDGWIVLPVLGGDTAWALHGAGFEPRARLQVRASAYLVP